MTRQINQFKFSFTSDFITNRFSKNILKKLRI